MDDAGPLSLFVLEDYFIRNPSYYRLVTLDIPGLQLDPTKDLQVDTPEDLQVVEKACVRFDAPPEMPVFQWLFSSPTSCSDDLYMVPYFTCSRFRPLNCFKFNIADGSFLPIKGPYMPSRSGNPLDILHGNVVNVRGDLYYMAHNKYRSYFQRYDHLQGTWKLRRPLPNDLDCDWSGPIVATAVWGDTILFRFSSNSVWAYDVKEDKWYRVQWEDKRCDYIVGEAVVLGDTIYAMSAESVDLVISLSIQKKLVGGDFVFTCFVGVLHFVPDMKPIGDLFVEPYWESISLVHLGGDNFCFVQTCNHDDRVSDGCQLVQLTYTKLKGENSRIVRNFFHKVKLQPPTTAYPEFAVSVCFSLPKCKTTGLLKQGNSFNMDLDVEAFPKGREEDVYLDYFSLQTDFSEGLAGLVSLFDDLKIQKSVESAINEIKEVKLELEVVADSEAAQIKQVESAKSEPIVIKRKKKKEKKKQVESAKSEPIVIKGEKKEKEKKKQVESAKSEPIVIKGGKKEKEKKKQVESAKSEPIVIKGEKKEEKKAPCSISRIIYTLDGKDMDWSSFCIQHKLKSGGQVSQSKTIGIGHNGGAKEGKKMPQHKVKELPDSLEESNKQLLEKSLELEELEIQKFVESATMLGYITNWIEVNQQRKVADVEIC